MTEDHLLVDIVNATWVVADVGGDGVVFGGDEVYVCSFVGLGVEHRLQNRVGNLCLRTTDDERAADVDVRVVVHQLRTGVGARRARQTGVERDTVVFVVPRIVNDVELVAAVEQSNRARIVAQVTTVALVHLKLVATSHVAKQNEDQRTKGHARYEHGVRQLGVKRLWVLVVTRVLNVRVSTGSKRHLLRVAEVHGVACETSRCVVVPDQQRLIGCDGQRGFGGDALIEGQGTRSDNLVGVVVRSNSQFHRGASAVGKRNDFLTGGVGHRQGRSDHGLR